MHKFRYWLRALFQKGKLDAELDAEMQAQEHIEAGMSPEAARYAALRQFGHTDGIKEICRDHRGWPWLESIGKDFRYALRMFGRSPGFTTVAVLTLAIGIGANTAIFSLLNAVVLQPLPFHEPERLVQILKSASWHGPHPTLGREEVIAWQRDNPVLEQIAAYSPG